MSAPTPPAGWYDDPTMVNTRRYWDGSTWTEHRQEVSAPLPTPSAQTKVTPPPRTGWVGLGYLIAFFVPPAGLVYGAVYCARSTYWGVRIMGLAAAVIAVYAVLVALGVFQPSWT